LGGVAGCAVPFLVDSTDDDINDLSHPAQMSATTPAAAKMA
jgi:hypothetical protein